MVKDDKIDPSWLLSGLDWINRFELKIKGILANSHKIGFGELGFHRLVVFFLAAA